MLCCTIYDVVNPAPNVQFYGGMCKSDIFLGFNSYKIKSVEHLFCDMFCNACQTTRLFSVKSQCPKCLGENFHLTLVSRLTCYLWHNGKMWLKKQKYKHRSHKSCKLNTSSEVQHFLFVLDRFSYDYDYGSYGMGFGGKKVWNQTQVL